MTRQPTTGRGIAADELRRHNLSTVLDRVHLAGTLSRSALAHQTGLNRSTIRDLLAELAALGLVTEDTGSTSGSPGRPSALATARPTGAVALAVELEVDYTAVATIGLGGQIFDEARSGNPSPTSSPEQIVELLTRLAAPLRAQPTIGANVVGVGVAAAGLVRRRDGVVSFSPNRGWFDSPLAEMIAGSLGIDRVHVANEADVGALAEYRRGAARNSQHMIYVSGEVGLGLGIIHNGAPMLGATGYAGEAGHTVINPQGLQCRCGSIGCWETEVSEEALARRAGLALGDVRQDLIDELLRQAHAGEPLVFEAFREVGHWLGLGIANLVNTFNPDLIVFGGFYHPLYPFLAPTLTASAQRSALSAPWEACRICRSELGLRARLVGAAELVFSEVIANPASFAMA